MNSKLLVGSLLILPIAFVGYAIFATKLNRESPKPILTKAPKTNDTSGFLENDNAKNADKSNHSFLESIRSYEEERTQIRYDLADRAAKRDTENYPSQREFLLNKHQSTFDAWNLSGDQRREVVGSVDNYTKDLGIAFRDSARSWPIQVAHAANKEANKKHAQALQQAVKDLKAKLYNELKTSIGAKLADDFMAKNYPPSNQGSAKQVLTD